MEYIGSTTHVWTNSCLGYNCASQYCLFKLHPKGQYGVGMIVTAALLVPVYNVNTLMGAVVALGIFSKHYLTNVYEMHLGFEGGHGTAAGVRSSFISLGYPAGAELTLCAATIGLISGLLFGTMVINWVILLLNYSTAF